MTTIRNHDFRATPITPLEQAAELREDSPTLAEAIRTAEAWAAIAHRDEKAGIDGAGAALSFWTDVAAQLRLSSESK